MDRLVYFAKRLYNLEPFPRTVGFTRFHLVSHEASRDPAIGPRPTDKVYCHTMSYSSYSTLDINPNFRHLMASHSIELIELIELIQLSAFSMPFQCLFHFSTPFRCSACVSPTFLLRGPELCQSVGVEAGAIWNIDSYERRQNIFDAQDVSQGQVCASSAECTTS